MRITKSLKPPTFVGGTAIQGGVDKEGQGRGSMGKVNIHIKDGLFPVVTLATHLVRDSLGLSERFAELDSTIYLEVHSPHYPKSLSSRTAA